MVSYGGRLAAYTAPGAYDASSRRHAGPDQVRSVRPPPVGHRRRRPYRPPARLRLAHRRPGRRVHVVVLRARRHDDPRLLRPPPLRRRHLRRDQEARGVVWRASWLLRGRPDLLQRPLRGRLTHLRPDGRHADLRRRRADRLDGVVVTHRRHRRPPTRGGHRDLPRGHPHPRGQGRGARRVPRRRVQDDRRAVPRPGLRWAGPQIPHRRQQRLCAALPAARRHPRQRLRRRRGPEDRRGQRAPGAREAALDPRRHVVQPPLLDGARPRHPRGPALPRGLHNDQARRHPGDRLHRDRPSSRTTRTRRYPAPSPTSRWR